MVIRLCNLEIILSKEEAIKGLVDSIDTVLLGIHKKYD